MSALSTDVFIELHVPDFNVAQDFYEKLGFQIVWRDNSAKGYMVMRRGRSILNFYAGSNAVYDQAHFREFPKNTPRGYAVEIILLSDDIENYFAEVSAKIDSIVEPLKLRRWGKKDFRLVDPFGFYIRIAERYDWLTLAKEHFPKMARESG